MAGPLPISDRFVNSIKDTLTGLAGTEDIEKNRATLTTIRNEFQARNKNFEFLDPYIELLEQPQNRDLLLFLSLCDTSKLEGILDTIREDQGSVEPARGQRRHGYRRGRAPGRAAIYWRGHDIHGLKKEEFTRNIVRYEGIRDKLSWLQYYCLLRNPQIFDRLLNPMEQLEVGVYTYRVGPLVQPPPDGQEWHEVNVQHWEHETGMVMSCTHYQSENANGWTKRVYVASDVANWNVLHYINTNTSDMYNMDATVEELQTRFDEFILNDDGRLTNILNNLPPPGGGN